MNTKQIYNKQNVSTNPTEQTVQSDAKNQSDKKLLNTNWFVPLDYHKVSAEASIEIVQKVAKLFDKFSSDYITEVLRDMMVTFFETRNLSSNDYSALLNLFQTIPELEHSLKLGRQEVEENLAIK